MKAFNGDTELKTKLVEQVIWHREQDMIRAGTYGSFSDAKFRGCAVGCSLHSYGLIKGINLDTSDHKSYELFGIPRLLARLEDGIFEGLPKKEQQAWVEQFMSAINVGADLSTVWPKFAVWLLIDKKHGVIQYAKNDRQRQVIQRVANLYKTGGTKQEFKAAAAYAAYAVADAAYADAAYAAAAYAVAVAAAAADAADAAAYAVAVAAADAAVAAAYAVAVAAYAADADADSAAAADAADAAAYAVAVAAAAADAADAAAYAVAVAAADADAAYAVAVAADAAAAYARKKARFTTRITQSKKLISLLKACI